MVATIAELLNSGAEDSPAIGGTGRTWLSYDGLRTLSRTTVEALSHFGIGHSDRVAIVLPNGPEMATAFLTIAQGAATAPLNPAYKQDEYEFYLGDLNAKALVIEVGYDGPALAAASKLGIAVIRLVADDGATAGMFHLEAKAQEKRQIVRNPDRTMSP